ncbi:hypothetical protein Barb6_01955 [Bacteroidales bacterium Barb6]|nr:hypothetical protein Barb6_01955 [Bacteroidales bacterium Barb6]
MTREEFINHGFHKDEMVLIKAGIESKCFVKGVDFGSETIQCELTNGIEINTVFENVELTEK